MSHFTVLVIASDVEAALQPFHEFECTGVSDEYVKDIDKTAEYRESYEADTSTRLKAPDGTLHSFFDDAGNWRPEFSQRDTSRTFSLPTDRTYFVPDGYEKVEVPTKTVETFAEWVEGYGGQKVVPFGAEPDLSDEHKYGYVLLDEAGEVVRVIDRTNPNKHWDWWTEDGRWAGKLLRKDGTRCDSALAGDVDWDGMIAAKAEDAANTYDAVLTTLAGRPVVTWAQAFARHKAGELTIEAARDLYNEQQVVKDLIAAKAIDDWEGAETLSAVMASERADYIRRQGELNASTWALLHDGEWSERGKMGWFACSDASDESTANQTADFWATVRALPADQLVTVVDCHI